MKKLFFLGLIALTSQVFSQSTNTFPSNGNVGVGTTTPSAKMDVNGHMKVDSSLLVKDSVTIEKNLRTKGEFVVEDDASFLKNVFINENLNVAGKIYIVDNLEVEGNAVIDSKLSVGASATFGSTVKMANLATVANLSNPNIEVVYQMPNGELKTGTLSELKAQIGIEIYEPFLCASGDIANPTWSNGLNKIFSACPQVNVGVGTSSPNYKMTVIGAVYGHKIILGNSNIPNDALVNGYIQNNTDDIVKFGKKRGEDLNQFILHSQMMVL